MEQKIKAIVRVANTDIDGNKSVYMALRKIRGISFMFSNAICNHLDIEKNKKIGAMNEKDIKDIESVIENPKFPEWMLNRRKDYDTGEDKHIVSAQIQLIKGFDIKRLQEVRSYRGLRLAHGLTVRGQKTRSHFRKGRSVGVQKKKIQQQKKGRDKKEGGKK